MSKESVSPVHPGVITGHFSRESQRCSLCVSIMTVWNGPDTVTDVHAGHRSGGTSKSQCDVTRSHWCAVGTCQPPRCLGQELGSPQLSPILGEEGPAGGTLSTSPHHSKGSRRFWAHGFSQNLQCRAHDPAPPTLTQWGHPGPEPAHHPQPPSPCPPRALPRAGL